MIVYLCGLLLKAISCALCLLILGLTAEKIRSALANYLCMCQVDLTNKVVLVTGGNGGIGFETAKILAKRGARVVIASRNVEKSQAAVQAIIEASDNPKVEYKPLDLGKFASIKQFADDFKKSYDRLDVLINNSGLTDRHQTVTEDGIENLTQVNHVGPTYLTTLLLDLLIASKPSRIIFVSSIAHKTHDFDPDDVKGLRRLAPWLRYGNTKLANILIARALSKTLPEGVTANSLHPGTASTEIFLVPRMLKKPFFFLLDCFFKTTEECAQTSVHLAMAPALANVTGEYFDECRIAKTHKVVTDDLAEKVWKNTMALIEEKSRNLENLN
ncbi:hypothetical protein ABMA27_005358 [Loxostege sticticalis]|uniref:Retinol dehydrogenase 13 n=1 Tax=Loxostege sticticalis TaxID=481309 RepID=A0ABR3HIV8_LOXSC